MIRMALGSFVPLMLLVPVPPAMAASFDCTAASTPFEHAICDNPELSSADDLLAKSFATAIGGLTKKAAGDMRADQRRWLDYAQRACTDDAEPLTEGSYDDEQAGCLTTLFKTRSGSLEDSRMQGGHRFYLWSRYATLPDPDAANEPDDYYWKVATHAVTVPLLDGDDALAADFNPFVRAAVENDSDLLSDDGGAEAAELDGQSDTNLTITVADTTSNRITLRSEAFWYGHGAAHGNWGVTFIHYLPQEKRALEAGDIFSGEGWEQKLLEMSVAELKSEHGDWLMLDDESSISAVVTDPARWNFASDYGLTIQFNPYEVAPYAYGAPTIVLDWEKLEDLLAENANTFRYGY